MRRFLSILCFIIKSRFTKTPKYLVRVDGRYRFCDALEVLNEENLAQIYGRDFKVISIPKGDEVES